MDPPPKALFGFDGQHSKGHGASPSLSRVNVNQVTEAL